MTNNVALQIIDHAHLAMEVASDLQASDILLLDIRKAGDFADYFIILSAESTRQMEALIEDIAHVLKAEGVTLHHKEGDHRTGWALLDFGDIIVHLFGPEEREFYNIENIWLELGAVEVVRFVQ